MNLVLRNTVARFILAAYVAAGILLEVGHHDLHDIPLCAKPAVASHTCGEREIHIPLDKGHDCLACAQSTQRLSVEAATYLGIRETPICLASIPLVHEQLLETDFIHSGKRGPPALPL